MKSKDPLKALHAAHLACVDAAWRSGFLLGAAVGSGAFAIVYFVGLKT